MLRAMRWREGTGGATLRQYDRSQTTVARVASCGMLYGICDVAMAYDR